MAYYAAVVSLVQLLEDIAHHGRYPNFLLHKHQIATLYEKFNLLQSSLDEFSPKNHQEESVDVLKRRIRDVSYKVQDIIKSHISTQIHRENNARGFKKLFRHLVSLFFLFFFLVNRHLVSASGQFLHHILGKEYQELEKVKEEVDSIVEELMRIKESLTTHEHSQQPKASISTEAQALSGRNTMVGFEEQLTTIKGQLCGEPSKLEVISIVGMGGLGKTTLARNIFNDKLIYDRFDCRAWVTVSQDYHIGNILLAIEKSLNINKEGLHEVGEGVLEEYMYKQLCGRRYLVIMDDLWETRVWDCVKRIFPNDCNGSRVILTTRLSDIASYAGLIYEMQFLNENQSWNLLCDKVFCPPELEDIGKLIAKNCRGLPLAIVVVAGILSKVNKTQHEWEEIARNVSSTAIDQNDEHLSKILSLSYNHLPHHLKPCFLYLGGFPEDYEIPVSRLTRLWVAEGFLRPIGSKSLEEVAEKYLEDLINRNLV